MIKTDRYDETAPIRVYVANLGKYNEGELVGTWLSLPMEEDDISEALRKDVGITLDPEEAFLNGARGERVYEEWAIHDWESDYLGSVSEYASIWALNEKAQLIEGWNEYQRQTMLAAIEVFGDDAWLHDVDDFSLYDDVNDEYDLGYYWAVESGCYHLDDREPLVRYFDYAAFGRDIAIESYGGFTSYGFVELT